MVRLFVKLIKESYYCIQSMIFAGMMEIQYDYFESEKLVIQKYLGTFDPRLSEIFFKRIFREMAEYKVDKVIVDFRSLWFLEPQTELPDSFEQRVEQMIDKRMEESGKVESNREVCLVFLVDHPVATIIAHMIVHRSKPSSHFYCSTEQKAVELLELNKSFQLSQAFLQLKKVCRDISQ